MVRAVTLGKLDCRQADWRDPAWWRYCRVVLQQLERQDEIVMLQTALQLQAGFLASQRIADNSWQEVQQRCQSIMQRLLRCLRPWLPSPEQMRQAQLDDVVRRYREVYGDPNSPEFQAKLYESLRRLEERDRQEAEEAARQKRLTRRERRRQQQGGS